MASIHKKIEANDGQSIPVNALQLQNTLNLFPNEILLPIVGEARISNLEQMFDQSFLDSNTNLKQVLIDVIAKRNLRFQNDPVERPFLEKEDTNVITVATSRGFQSMFNLYVAEGINAVHEIDFCIRKRHHYSDFQLLLESLKQSEQVKLKVSLENCCWSHDTYLDRLSDSFMRVKDVLDSVGLLRCNTACSIDLDCFSNVKELSIVGYNVRGSLENFDRLEKFHYEPDKHCDIDFNLPLSLKSLNLYQCQRYKQSLQTLRRYRFSLEEIYLQFDSEDEEFSGFMVSLLENLTCAKTSKVAFKSSKFESTDFMLNQYLHDMTHLATPLKLLSVDFLGFPLTPIPSGELELSIGQPIEHHIASNLLPNLRALRLGGKIANARQMWEVLPPNIEVLDVSHALQSPLGEEMNFARFQNLKELYLRGNDIGHHVSDISFPNSVEILNLCGCSIGSISGVRFPKCLLMLDLLNNHIRTIYRPHFPKLMRKLNISCNELVLCDLSLNALKEPLNITLLDWKFEADYVRNHVCMRLPSGIAELNAEFCEPFDSTLEFLASLQHLSLTQSHLMNIAPLKLDSCINLKYLCLVGSTYTLNDTSFPPSLEEIDFLFTYLREAPTELSNLPRLRVLDLSMNLITHVDIELSSSVESLNLSGNRIESLLLSFNGDCEPRLRNLFLERNKLKEITGLSLGFRSDVVHKDMYELDLSDNEEVTMGQGLLLSLSNSLQYLWITDEDGMIVNKGQGVLLSHS